MRFCFYELVQKSKFLEISSFIDFQDALQTMKNMKTSKGFYIYIC